MALTVPLNLKSIASSCLVLGKKANIDKDELRFEREASIYYILL